jgi:hypothetical protein
MHAPDPAVEDLSDDALLTRVDVTYVGANAAMAHWLSLVAEVDRRRLWVLDGHHGLASWLRWKYRLCRQTSKEKARVAKGTRVWRAATAAFAAGDLSYSALRQIVRLPAHDPETEQRLIAVAKYGTADDVARLVNRALDLAGPGNHDPHADAAHGEGDAEGEGATDPDGAEPHEPDAFEQRRMWAARTLDGTVTGGFTLAPAEGALLLAAIDTYLDGRHPGAPRSERVAAATPSASPSSGDDPRNIDQKRADAFTEFVCAYLAGGAPDSTGADRHTLNVVCDLDTLLSGQWHDGSTCETLDGTALALSLLRRLRCDSSLVRVLTTRGRILDIGTRNRSIPPALRKKLLLRDRGCVYPGCPHSRWVDAHHITWVDNGGGTDAANLCLLCGFHHHLVHDKGWTITGDPEAGTLTFHRPDGTAVPAVPPRREAA